MEKIRLLDAVRSNDRRAALVALRDTVADSIEFSESARDIAALSKRLMEIMGELDALPDPNSSDRNPAQLARERARRRAGSS